MGILQNFISLAIFGCFGILPVTVGNNSLEKNALLPAVTKDLSYYPLENSLPRNHVKDGSIDYSKYIQLAISNHRVVVFPGYPLLINDGGIKIPSNRRLIFKKGSELRLMSSNEPSYSMLSLRNVSNVTLESPVIRGDRKIHRGTKGEWGMGIDIRGSKNISITNASINDCWGDGIYIDGLRGVVPKNIKLLNVSCRGNRRDGISVISADSLLIKNSYFGYTSGTAPMAGINFEPNNPSSELKNIRVINVKTERNGGYGIQIGLSKMYGPSQKNVSFYFENIMDNASKTGFKTSSIPKEFSTIQGRIHVKNPSWRKNATRPIKILTNDKNLNIVISRPEIIQNEGGSLVGNEARKILTKKGNISSLARFSIEQ